MKPGDVGALRGLVQLAGAATASVSEIVETIHADVLRAPWPDRGSAPRRTPGLTGLVYASVRGIARLASRVAVAALERAPHRHSPHPAAPEETRPDWETFVAVLNGVLGDHLRATGNPLAIPMTLRVRGQGRSPDGRSLDTPIPPARRRVVVMVHGLCRGGQQWERNGHDHGAALERDLAATLVCVNYNTGLNVSTNGRELSDLLEEFVASWPAPIEELVLIGHSMGGLVIRSACHYGGLAGRRWPQRLSHVLFLGTPHHGAPLERIGHRLEAALEVLPYVGALGRLGQLRSAGITDLRHGNIVDEHWRNHDRFVTGEDHRCPVPLPHGVDCHAIAATHGRRRGDARDVLLGDGLVSLKSALGEHADASLDLGLPETHRWIAWESGHLDLLGSTGVYRQILARLSK